MDETKLKLEYLLRKEVWDDEDREWMRQYLNAGDVTLLQQISVQQYGKDVEKAGQIIDEKLSGRVLENICGTISRQRRRSRIYRISLAAAAILLLFILTYIYRDKAESPGKSPQYVQVNTKPGQRKAFVLADGTHVWLSPASRLVYPDKFIGETREVELSGEAFFEVAKNAAHPFVVRTALLSTKILGTSFDISAYKDRDYSSVTVATGRVSVEAGKGSDGIKRGAVELLPDQRIVFDKKDQILTEEKFPDADRLLKERREGYLEYRGAILSTVVKDLSLQYGVKIKVNRSMEKCTYYGGFDVHEGLQVSLRVLCLTLNAKLIKEGDAYIIDGRGC